MDNLAYEIEIWDEMLDGKLVAMSPRPAVNHNIVAENIIHIFMKYLKGKPCKVFGEVDVFLSEKDRIIPDAMIVCDKNIIKQNGIHGAPDLIVEVLSPSTATKDKGYKKKLYAGCGVKEYWIVDTDNRSIEVYLLQDGLFELDYVYVIFPDYTFDMMTEDEKSKIKYEFAPSMFPDMVVPINEVFERLF